MAIKFTNGRVEGFQSEGKMQIFFWDSHERGLGVRVTPSAKAYVFQGRLGGKTLRVKIGDVRTLTLEDARSAANKLQMQIDEGKDPRQEKAKEIKKSKEEAESLKRDRLAVGDAWAAYIEAKKEGWSERHLKDHHILSRKGGQPAKRGKKKIKPGPLAQFMNLRLSEITADRVEEWLKKETPDKPGRMRLAFSLLRAFLNWCETQGKYKGIPEPGACGNHLKREHIPKMKPKDDCLQKEQLKAWFEAIRQLTPGMSAYLQALLLTGARRNELAGLEWDHVDFQWQSLTIHDKVAGIRTIPLTPYLSSVLYALPRRNQFVFSSPTSKSGRLEEPRKPHNKALEVAGIPYLTIHGLRRSFATLSEWQECPVGVVAQIMGHKPSAIAERHYKKRPLDLLRMWHTKIEKFILVQAGIAQPEPGQAGLKIVGE